jgi:hypothetical protein
MVTSIRVLLEKYREKPVQWVLFAGALFLIGVSALLLPLSVAIPIHAYGGYFFCATLLAAICYFSFQVIREADILDFVFSRWKGLLLVGLAAISVHLHKPHMMRVFNDEPAHQMVAKQLHETRVNSVPEVGYRLEGGLAYGERSLNYRMYFYPFLVSILHDVTGFRVANALWLNAALGLLLFLLVYLGGNRIYSPAGGVIAVLLLAGLPLVDESVTSYGYDIANLCFLALYFLALIHYAERPDALRLNWLIALGLGLAYSRNESVLYLLATGVLVGVSLLRNKAVNLSWFASLSPCLLLPILAARRIFETVNANLAELFPHLSSDRFFSLSFIPENMTRVGAWLFDFSTTTSSYPVLSLTGVIGLVALASGLLGDLSKRKAIHSGNMVLVLFLASILGSFVFVTLSLFWDPVAGEAVRFLLPLHLGLTYASVWLVTRSTHPRRLTLGIILIAVAGLFFVGIPTKMRGIGGANAVFARYVDWSLEWLEQEDDENTLYLSQVHTLFLLHKYPAIDLNRAGRHVAEIAQLEAEDYYKRIVIFVIEKFDPKTGEWNPPRPTEPLSEHFVTEVIDERRWAFNQRARFLELTGYYDENGYLVCLEDLPSQRDQYKTFQEYWSAMLRLHPGYPR